MTKACGYEDGKGCGSHDCLDPFHLVDFGRNFEKPK
jgi:hypothetical protein